MGQTTSGLRRPLSSASIYSLVQRTLGASAVRRCVIDEYLRPEAGDRVLDLGCGPGDILALFGGVSYLGVDLSPAYIDAARREYGHRARFICADVRELVLDEEQFDAVIAIGMLHHLDDDAAAGLVELSRAVLRRGGRLVTLDTGHAEGQSRIARWLIDRDRGQNVRTPEEYKALAAPLFGDVRVEVRHDLARVPYTHVILECRDPRSD